MYGKIDFCFTFDSVDKIDPQKEYIKLKEVKEDDLNNVFNVDLDTNRINSKHHFNDYEP